MYELLFVVLILTVLVIGGYGLELIFTVGTLSVLTTVVLGMSLIYFDTVLDNCIIWFMFSLFCSMLFLVFICYDI
jgi:hypothetical protein